MSDDTDRPEAEAGADAGPEVDFNAEMENLVDGAAGLFESLRDIFLKSKQEVVRGAKLGKVRIDVFQLRKDREHFLQRLGEEAYELLQAGTIDHPDLQKPFAKLTALDEKIAEHEAEMALIAEEVAEGAEAAAEDAEATAEAAEVVADAVAPESPAAPEAADAEPKTKGKAKGKKTPKKDL